MEIFQLFSFQLLKQPGADQRHVVQLDVSIIFEI